MKMLDANDLENYDQDDVNIVFPGESFFNKVDYGLRKIHNS